ncbi:leucyl aminopeptidase family protein [Pigmentibacter sp. JX0631]|uniref:leucyl aminopeptidase family protein n=1 Tax=Pigmentibacter sp. JX0631 TaxID=2976982 RepID=UPI002468E0A8|nr:leucyl aminopeptidase family protein [Pigmentibacter sp. JX0631]WGL58761.1 leucyl aminopeptidase family protein [Pigmentibacter sp. JX0631]
MLLPQLKPLHITNNSHPNNQPQDLAIIVIDEQDIEKGQLKSKTILSLDNEMGGTISNLIALGDFEGKWLQTSTSLVLNQKFAKRILLVGAGNKLNYLPARSRQIGIKCAETALNLKAATVHFYCTSQLCSSKELIAQSRLGFNMGMYKYPNSNMKEEAKIELEKPIQLNFVHTAQNLQDSFEEAKHIEDSINFCRLLQDSPPNVATPKFIAHQAIEQAKKVGLKVEVWGAEKLREKGFNAMLAVSNGSANEPQFVVIEYSPEKFEKSIAFVGKGLTMDTGGYSIKTPSTSQEGMKYDMSGAAVTLSSILAIAKLKLPIKVYAVAALCENMIDAHSYRVGDVITSYSGKTIEILNTDAEGRVVLSDALYFAAKDLNPNYIVEFSTLTGAMITTFGHIGAGVFAFHPELEKIIMTASDATGERAYPLPIWDEVIDDVKGSISDIINIGNTRGSAGSMVGAAFLNEFTNNIPFAHIDIAGVANDNLSIGYIRKHSSGYGVQLVTEIARILAK